MVPSALRFLSVAVLLGAVSAPVIATTPHSPASTPRAQETDPVRSGRIVLTAVTTPLADVTASPKIASRTTPRHRATPRSSRAIARVMVADRGWKSSQYTCLVKLWNRESGWHHTAHNPSGAYGIPQSLPGHKMASAGRDWKTNPATQIRWGLRYIDDRYGSPCGAWRHSRSHGWY